MIRPRVWWVCAPRVHVGADAGSIRRALRICRAARFITMHTDHPAHGIRLPTPTLARRPSARAVHGRRGVAHHRNGVGGPDPVRVDCGAVRAVRGWRHHAHAPHAPAGLVSRVARARDGPRHQTPSLAVTGGEPGLLPHAIQTPLSPPGADHRPAKRLHPALVPARGILQIAPGPHHAAA